jgi:hypothetical protein
MFVKTILCPFHLPFCHGRQTFGGILPIEKPFDRTYSKAFIAALAQ